MAVRGTGTAFPHAYPPSFTYISVCIILKRKRKHTAIPIFPLTIDEFLLCIRSMNTTPISSKMCHPNGYPRGVQERQAWLATTGDPPPHLCKLHRGRWRGFRGWKKASGWKEAGGGGLDPPPRGGVSPTKGSSGCPTPPPPRAPPPLRTVQRGGRRGIFLGAPAGRFGWLVGFFPVADPVGRNPNTLLHARISK